MAKWIDVGAAGGFPPGTKQCVQAGDRSVVVCHLQGPVKAGERMLEAGQTLLTAVDNVCPHAGLPLGDGELAGTVLTCPYHGYAFDVASGRNIDYPDDAPVRRLAVRVREGRVEVDVDDAP